MTEATEQSAADLWNSVAAERAGEQFAPAAPAAQPAQTVQAAPATPNPEQAKPDPIAEIQARLNEFQQSIANRLRGVEGHIGGLKGAQQELKGLMEASKVAAANASSAPTQAQVQQAASSPQEWDDLKKDYPEWATGVEKLFDARLGAIKPADNGFDPKAFETALKAELKGQTDAVRKEIIDSSLEAVFPDWKNTVKTENFHQWTAGQPQEIKDLIQKSDKVGDAAKVLRMYELHKQANPAQQIIDNRKRVLENATGTQRTNTSPPATKAWEDMTAAEKWQAEARRRAKSGR